MTTVAATPGGGLLGGQAGGDGSRWLHLGGEHGGVPSVGVTFQFPRHRRRRSRRAVASAHHRGPHLRRSEKGARCATRPRRETAGRRARLRESGRARTARAILHSNRSVPIVERRSAADDASRRRAEHSRRSRLRRPRERSPGHRGPAAEAALVAPLLKEKNIPVILLQRARLAVPSRTCRTRRATRRPPNWPGPVSNSRSRLPSETNARQLPYHAAKSVAWGLSREDALKALTINAAEILGVERPHRQPRNRQNRQPVHRQRRSAGSANGDHARRHRRP